LGYKVLRFRGPKLRFNCANYKEIIRKPLLTTLQRDPQRVFQHDGSKVHTSKMMRTWFEAHNVKLLEPWPANSAGLNPIENFWYMAKSRMNVQIGMRQEDLKVEFRKAWDSIQQSKVDEIVLDYDARVQRLVEWRGFDVQKPHLYKQYHLFVTILPPFCFSGITPHFRLQTHL
jgi:hypothetical protein